MNSDRDQRIMEWARSLKENIIARRRDFHRYAETAWTEFRTAAIVAGTLTELGYEVLCGEEVIAPEGMMGVPDEAELERHAQRAVEQGADSAWVDKMRGGKTGVVGVMRMAKPGPTVALRFDMDANDLMEAAVVAHRPYRDGFASVNPGAMHACGHDGHTAIGLAVAELLSRLQGELVGTVKLIFQPAEEGVRGAKAMVEKGMADAVDYVLGMHLGGSLRTTGQIACRTQGFLATTKADAEFSGVPSHAGATPEAGRNALLAAANAALNLHAISRHSAGDSRVNVGVMKAGSGRNVIPEHALIQFETRGMTSVVNEYIYQEALRVIRAAADMYGVTATVKVMGSSVGAAGDPALSEHIRDVAARLGLFTEILPENDAGGSEDYTYFMTRVQQHGGQAGHVVIGTELAANHHHGRFDFNEDALELAAVFMTAAAADLLVEPGR